MKRSLIVILIAILCIVSLYCLLAYAHSGNTDSDGGHYNRSTGEYHYHHGEPAHQHKDGKCPYDINWWFLLFVFVIIIVFIIFYILKK